MATIGCIRAKMGDTPYYLAKMSAGQLIDSVGIAKELPEWPDMNADEKMQREYDIKRVVEEMVPYVVDDPNRFFGSLIIDIYSGYEGYGVSYITRKGTSDCPRWAAQAIGAKNCYKRCYGNTGWRENDSSYE